MQFDEYVGRYSDGLLRHATSLTLDPQAALDIVQVVLERAYRHWDRISSMDYVDAYVRRMIVNEVISSKRRLTRWILVAQVPDRADHAERKMVCYPLLMQEAAETPGRYIR